MFIQIPHFNLLINTNNIKTIRLKRFTKIIKIDYIEGADTSIECDDVEEAQVIYKEIESKLVGKKK